MRNYNNFDWKKYINSYDDLKHVPNKALAWRHWNRFGIREKREAYFKEVDDKLIISKEYFENNYTIYITRHMNNDTTSRYWIHNYHCIRRIYSNVNIVIIDDNSNPEYLVNDNNFNDVTFKYINKTSMNKLIGCGELLPFYMFHNDRPTTYALFIHDSVFIHKPIHKFIFESDYISLWSFKSLNWYRQLYVNSVNILSKFNNGNELVKIYKQYETWEGNFGCMCVVSKYYIDLLNSKFNFLDVGIKNIYNREDRMVLERALAIYYNYLHGENPPTIFDDIHSWALTNISKMWDLSWKEYIKNETNFQEIPLIKIWSGR